MSWRLAIQSTKLFLSYLLPYKIKQLRDAIFNGQIQTIQQLTSERPRLLHQAIDADGNTALGLAIQLGEIEVVKVLLELGSDPNVANTFDGSHPLFIVARLSPQENPKIPLLAEILLEGGSDPLYEVHPPANNDISFDATNTPSFYETPLLCCIRCQNEDLLKKFIEHKVDINTQHKDTLTSPLMLAAALGFNHICNILILAGADVTARDYQGNTPLHLGVQNLDVIHTLLEHGAQINSVNHEGHFPYTLAQQTQNDTCVNLLKPQIIDNSSAHIYEELDDSKFESIFLSF